MELLVKKQKEKLKFRSHPDKDKVVVGNNSFNNVRQLHNLMGTAHIEYIPVDFYVYKKKPSWVQFPNGKRIDFTYDITSTYPIHSIDISTRGQYTLSFMESNKKWFIRVQVKDSCYPKKTIIKHLLNCIANQ